LCREGAEGGDAIHSRRLGDGDVRGRGGGEERRGGREIVE